jgi:glycerol-3-phosphate acyltransferase PlsY
VQVAFFPNFPELNVLKALAGVGAFAGHCWMPWLKFQGGKGFAVLTGASIMINPWGVVIYWVSLPIWLLITRYSYIGGICGTTSVALGYTIFYLTGATAWPHWSLMIYGWGCVILVNLRMIPDFIAMRKGEIKRWKGIKISQWMR